MRNNRFSWIFFVVVGIISSGCSSLMRIDGNGNIITQERTVTAFGGIELDGVGNINIHFSENYRVTVTTDSNIQDIIITNVNDNILYIDEKEEIDPTKLEIDIYIPKIESIISEGVGNITIDDGNNTNLKIKLTGVGNIDAQNYQVQNVNVKLDGVGNVKTWAINTLEGELSGVGDILYKGDPIININSRGIGKIKKL